ncbi:hypothetical protein [Sphingobium boeckii]|uniref:Formate hydrogenlyase subunit 3/multisubunit Na+/H+ antiporter MnhD subunit n=1 Tax=Sphingobium boeckii TaxID=1082345 RepID=A0A7W9AGX9_9SPHN|nr:hypothetical protein [Sphingobium boeckii]MBB5685317.1 formate hydrogenlyase subunit 3/multisubunit Na+/H+ antiporter MnhD subunit [Sphingobium boeckii]
MTMTGGSKASNGRAWRMIAAALLIFVMIFSFNKVMAPQIAAWWFDVINPSRGQIQDARGTLSAVILLIFLIVLGWARWTEKKHLKVYLQRKANLPKFEDPTKERVVSNARGNHTEV